MALIIPTGFAQAVYEITLLNDPQPMVVTLGHDVSAIVGTMQTAAELLHTRFQDTIRTEMGNDYRFEGVSLYVGQGVGPPLVFESTQVGANGLGGASSLPQNCAHLVRKRTSAAGRRGRGRLYLPGVNESSVNNIGVMDNVFFTAIQNKLNSWYAALTAPTTGVALPPVILHRAEGIGVEPAPTPVTVFSLSSTVATQRRRLRP